MRRQLEGSSASCGFDSPVREERPLVKDAVHAFQLEEVWVPVALPRLHACLRAHLLLCCQCS
eukprot:18742-Eustigmatos_ZCMA.PRE.1